LKYSKLLFGSTLLFLIIGLFYPSSSYSFIQSDILNSDPVVLSNTKAIPTINLVSNDNENNDDPTIEELLGIHCIETNNEEEICFDMGRNPYGMQGFPGGMQGFPGGMQGFPGGMQGFSNLNINPNGLVDLNYDGIPDYQCLPNNFGQTMCAPIPPPGTLY
jgi:hypothetical protein